MTTTLTHEEAQQVLDALETWFDKETRWNARETLRARLSAPEPEPVAWMYLQSCLNDDGTQTSPWVKHVSRFKPFESVIFRDVTPLYTATPQREWQGLTDEEITALKHNGERYISSQDFARAIEQALKEKNHG